MGLRRLPPITRIALPALALLCACALSGCQNDIEAEIEKFVEIEIDTSIDSIVVSGTNYFFEMDRKTIETTYKDTGFEVRIPASVESVVVTVTKPNNNSLLELLKAETGISRNALQYSVGPIPLEYGEKKTVVFMVTAKKEDYKKNYAIHLTRSKKDEKSLNAFSVKGYAGQAGVINEALKTVSLTLPFGVPLTSLIAEFAFTGKSVTVGGTPQISGTTPNDFTNPVVYRVTAENESTVDYTVTIGNALSDAKSITAFGIIGYSVNAETINENDRTISITLPYGAVRTNLIATFTTTGTSVMVGDVVQQSAITANDFTDSVAYEVIAQDGTRKTYTVTITNAPKPLITAFGILGYEGRAGTIDESDETISLTLPFGAVRTNLIATFTTTGTNVTVNTQPQTSGTTVNDFTDPVVYMVPSLDGSQCEYTVTIAIDPAITAFRIRGYEEFASTINHAARTVSLTLPYGVGRTNLIAEFTTTGMSVSVGGVIQQSGATVNDFTNPVAYQVLAEDGTHKDYEVTVINAPSDAKAITAFQIQGFDGNTGIINEDDGTIAVVLPFGVYKTSLVAVFSTTGKRLIIDGVIQNSGTTPNDFTHPVKYSAIAEDGTEKEYTITVTNAFNNAKAITAFKIQGYDGNAGTIDEINGTISIILPYGIARTSLVAVFATTGTSVTVNGENQNSGETANDFSNQVKYLVIAQDSTSKEYTVIVANALNSDKAISGFYFQGYSLFSGTIDESGGKIQTTLPYGVTVTSLTAVFTTTGSGVFVNDTIQTSGVSVNNFSEPVDYLVIAEDGSLKKYTVIVSRYLPSKILVSISFDLPDNVSFQWSNAAISIVQGTNITVTAQPSLVPDSYEWRINGETVQGAASENLTIGAALPRGNHTLTLIVKKGNQFYSDSIDFIVTKAQ